VAGFRVEWTSYQEQPHPVVPFPATPAELPTVNLTPPPLQVTPASPGLRDRFLNLLGLQTLGQAAAETARWQAWAQSMEAGMRAQQVAMQALATRTETLWAVNQTWAWDDNATIRLRRHAD
jgi:O-antigen chain-terminating methyltransferase